MFVTGITITPEAEQITERLLGEVTIDTQGDSLASYNALRDSPKTATTSLYTDSTLTDSGEEFESIYMPGESGVGQNRRGDRYNGAIEWIVQPNIDNALELENTGETNNVNINVEISWFEIDFS
jgi:hypothetical protein